MTRVPSLPSLVGAWLAAVAVALLVVGVFTQPTHSRPARSCNEIPDLVLDGGSVTTTGARSSVGRPVERIPRRELGDPTTTTTEACR